MEQTGGLAAVVNDGKPLDRDSLKDLEKEVAYKRLASNDPGLAEATIQMLSMAQGLKGLSYLMPEVTAAGRVTNAIRESDVTRLLGVPRSSDIKNFVISPDSRDKVLWTATGNVVKGSGVVDRGSSK